MFPRTFLHGHVGTWDMADGIDSYRPRAGEIRSSICASSWLRFLASFTSCRLDPMDSDVNSLFVFWSWNVADRARVRQTPGHLV